MADHTRATAPFALCLAHLAAPPFVLELARDAAVEVPEPGADDRDPDRAYEPAAGRPAEDGRGGRMRFLVLRLLLARARDDLDRRGSEAGVDHAAADVAHALARLLRLALLIALLGFLGE